MFIYSVGICYNLFWLFIRDYYANHCIHFAPLFLVNCVRINKQNHQTHLVYCVPRTCLLSHGSTVPVGLGLLCDVPWSPLDTRCWVGILRTSYRTITETSTKLIRDRHLCPWWDSNPQSQQVSVRRLALYITRQFRMCLSDKTQIQMAILLSGHLQDENSIHAKLYVRLTAETLFSKMPINSSAFGTKDYIRTTCVSLFYVSLLLHSSKYKSAYRLYVHDFGHAVPSFLPHVHERNSILHIYTHQQQLQCKIFSFQSGMYRMAMYKYVCCACISLYDLASRDLL